MAQAATSPQLLRRVNADAVLAVLRRSAVVTVTDLMVATGLTRATVLAVCEDLIEAGWVLELANMRDSGGDYTKGRPARRFCYHTRAGVVIGVDLGLVTATVVVADLAGTPLSRISRRLSARPAGPDQLAELTGADRLAGLDAAILAGLAEAGIEPDEVLAVTVGVPAPVSRSGKILATSQFWEIAGVDARAALGEKYGWLVALENDANLAALGECWQGAAQGRQDLVALLSGERFGAGVMESGRLLHGAHGGLGEMAYLDHVAEVGSPYGVATRCRMLGEQAVRAPGPRTLIRELSGGDPQAVTAELVFEAARSGDEVAVEIVGRVLRQLALVIGTLSSLLNPELVIVCGAVAASIVPLVDRLTAELATVSADPPVVVASTLGDSVVTIGALRHALDQVEANALNLLADGAPSAPLDAAEAGQ